MNSIKWIDADNMLVCMEAGIVGQDLKRRLEVCLQGRRFPMRALLHRSLRPAPALSCGEAPALLCPWSGRRGPALSSGDEADGWKVVAERGLYHWPRARLSRCRYYPRVSAVAAFLKEGRQRAADAAGAPVLAPGGSSTPPLPAAS